MNKYIVVTDQKLLFPQFVKNFGILNLGVDPGPGDLFNSDRKLVCGLYVESINVLLIRRFRHSKTCGPRFQVHLIFLN